MKSKSKAADKMESKMPKSMSKKADKKQGKILGSGSKLEKKLADKPI